MAGYIKGITIEFGANTEKLNSALKKTQGTINKTQAELKQINNALKFNPGNTMLLRQKFEALQKSVGETSAKLNQLKQMQKEMNAAGVDKTSAQYRQLEREIIKTEGQLKTAEAELRRFGSVGKQQALAVGNAFKTAGSKIKSAGRTITTSFSVYGLAGIYAGSKLIEMSQQQSQAEQKLTEIYKTRMGATKGAAKATMDLASALQQQGVVGDEVALSFGQQMATYASAPSTVNKLMPAFENLLVQQKGLNGTQEDAVNLANMFGKAMMGQTGALKKAGISFTEEQEKVLKYGTEEEKAAMLAEVVTQNVGNMNEEFAKTDAGKIQQAKNALGDMGEEIGAVLLPAVADLVAWFQKNLMPKIQQFIDFLKQHPQIAKFALALALVTAALGPLLMIVGSVVSVIGSLVTIASTLGITVGALVAPIGIAIAAIAGVIAVGVLLYKNWDKIKATLLRIWMIIHTKAKAIWDGIKNKISSVVNGIKTKVSSVFTAVKDKVVSVFGALKDKVKSIWDGIKNAITHPIQTAKDKVKAIIDKIKSFFPFNVGKLFNFKLPSITAKKGKSGSLSYGVGWVPHAAGGIYTRPTLLRSNGGAGHLVGEAGSEAILPLDTLWKHMDQMAHTIAGGSAGGTWNITVNGADDPELWASRFAHEFKMQMRIA